MACEAEVRHMVLGKAIKPPFEMCLWENDTRMRACTEYGEFGIHTRCVRA